MTDEKKKTTMPDETENKFPSERRTLDFSQGKAYASRGSGLGFEDRLRALGEGVVIEDGVRIFHPGNVALGANVFVGHNAHLDGYHNGHIKVGEGTWIGQLAFLHGAGGIDIGRAVGIGPRVTVLTSEHDLARADVPVLHADLSFAGVTIGDGADIGASAVVLPGCTIGEMAVVGAGAVVTRDVPAYAVAAGNPARVLRQRS
jgi:acetyltransferase-like isoleucine patch superfamily enzyme